MFFKLLNVFLCSDKTFILDDFSGMGREVEHLIHENTQLLETKLVLIRTTNKFYL